MKRAKSPSSHGAVLQNERVCECTAIGGSVLQRMCVSESAGREADAERCCNAQRPASVRVVTTVETPHNIERQKEEGVERNRPKKRRKIH